MRKFAIPFFLLLLCTLGVSANFPPSASISALNVPLVEDFNSLVATNSSPTTPNGWTFSESGTSTTNNGLLVANNGGANAGDTYSYGTGTSPERALGQLRSGTLVSTIGASYQNNTGATIAALAISYRGEQWRLGQNGAHTTTPEKMDFQYSTDATSLGTGIWVDFNALDFASTVITGTVGAQDGNANAVLLSGTISGLSIPPGGTIFFKWLDVDAAPGSDDGLAIDDFTITASGAGDQPPGVLSTSPANTAAKVGTTVPIVINFNESVTATSANAFSITCGAPVAFMQSPAPNTESTTFTLTPAAELPQGASCVVAVDASLISDVDPADPPDTMAANYSFSFTTDSGPAVTAATPANGTTDVSKSSNVVITFSEAVNASGSAFVFDCGAPVTFMQSASPGASYTLTPASRLPASATCTVTVRATQVTDVDAGDPPDAMASDYSFSFQTAAADSAPFVQSATPPGGSFDVPVTSNIVLMLSENVTAPSTAFSLQCPDGTPRSFGVTGSGSSAITIDPDADLPYSTACRLTVSASLVMDTDADDPPDEMAADYSISFTTEPRPPASNVFINELDADTPGDDRAEFIELYDGGVGNTPLDGLVLVLYDGGTTQAAVNKVYAQFDLDGYSTDASGYFVLGNPGVSNVSLEFQPGQFGLLQNGADAAALYAGSAADFPNGFPASGPIPTAGLRDAIVYDTDDADNTTLLPLLNGGQPQVNEASGDDSQHHSSSRCENGTGGARNTDTYLPTTPTPGVSNACPAPNGPSTSIVISQFYGSGGNSGAVWENDFVELYNLGSQTVDLAGWSLQYAAAAGRGWDFNMTPLGGPIAPGEYYLVKLAAQAPPSGQTEIIGEPLPINANVSGPINMSGSNGKIALVNNMSPLRGDCPLSNPHLVDLVGYGSANCGEGMTKAPALGPTRSDFRINGGAIDTNDNAADFAFGTATPRRTAPIVELGPMIVSSDPPVNGSDVPRDPTIAITFSEPVTVALGERFYELVCTVSGQHGDFTAVNNDRFLDVTLNVNLVPGETCTFTLFHNLVHDTDTDDSEPNTDMLFADYSSSFTVASGTPPPFPPDVHVTFGNPTNATNDPANFDNYLMAKPEYSLSYNRDLGRPNWVSWHLSSEWYGNLTRVDTFRADPEVPPDWYRVQGFDFTGSGFDRGHMVPNADRDNENSKPINQATYLMTNMIAQSPDNNQGPWAAFEAYLRTLADAGNELYIVAGPAGAGGTGSGGVSVLTIAGGHVTVPASTWKVALVLPKAAGDDVARVSCATRSIAVIMPNVQGIRNDQWEGYLTTVDAVEALTGYNLFANLPAQFEYCVEAGTNGVNPVDNEPPTITLSSPVAGASYALNSAVNASFTCADRESRVASCIGTTASGAAIDTASTGPKTFVVTATDAVGNSSSRSVSYTVTNGPAHKRTPSISITNIPSSGAIGGSVTPAYSYDGDGNIHLMSLTPSVCKVQADSVVNFIGAGTCTLVPWATASGSVNPAQGAMQSFAVTP